MLKKWLKKCADDSEVRRQAKSGPVLLWWLDLYHGCHPLSQTSNWLATNTKECPKCKATIEKSGGCNHMTCHSCRYDFCWQVRFSHACMPPMHACMPVCVARQHDLMRACVQCMGDWEPHGSSWYQCNRFDDEASKAAQADMKTSRASLERYLFYFNRYANHNHSMTLEGKLWKMVEAKQKEMQRRSMSWIEVQVPPRMCRYACLLGLACLLACSIRQC